MIKTMRNAFGPGLLLLTLLVAVIPTLTHAEGKVPSTPEEHFVLTKQYRQKAETYRKEAKDHQEMAAAYKNSAANAHEKGHGQKNPFVVKMEKHCGLIAAKAEALAKENEKAADYHELRGKELQGK
jgi:hypothetical protein